MKKLLVFGMLIGAALGLLGGGIDILIWSSTGRPDVLVRPGWERVHIGMTFVGGLLAGLIYAAILSNMIDRKSLHRKAAFILSGTFLVAIATYAATDLLSVRVLNIYPWLGGHLVVFLTALAIARLVAGPPRGRPCE